MIRDLVETALTGIRFDLEDKEKVAETVTRLIEAEAAAAVRETHPQLETASDQSGEEYGPPPARRKGKQRSGSGNGP
ncbi:MAG TPA: hypothetical protein VIT45_17230 [Allosphingosinicella sp.]